MRIVLAFAIMALQGAATAQVPVRDVESQLFVGPHQPLPGFYGGYAFVVDRPSYVKLYSPNGDPVLATPLPYASVMSVAVDSDNTIAIGYTSKGLGGIDLLDTKGNRLDFFSTGTYLPSHIAFGNDHSVWIFGWQTHGIDPLLNTPEYMSVRHYTRSGVQTGAYLPRSLFPKGLEPACEGWQKQGIYIANDRIGLLACSGMNEANPEWVELDFNGNLIGRWHVGSVHRRVALTQDGHVYSQDTVNGSNQVYVLDRATGAFQPAPWAVPKATMYGADGDELVFADWNTMPMHFHWYKQP